MVGKLFGLLLVLCISWTDMWNLPLKNSLPPWLLKAFRGGGREAPQSCVIYRRCFPTHIPYFYCESWVSCSVKVGLGFPLTEV